ncbi:MAG TPA: zinc-dependent alcohol dehydrogenase family protein [Candidatus Baltobacteraceae bacterium]|jgi:propanol-preferring alcohol dehydrogenase|nr:zinc-dependent alcohol dehydrogenase family protein [Candidatus Baltobacteraceae bacterium]
MVLEKPGQPLRLKEVPVPRPKPGQILIRISACGVCRTDLHILDGDLPEPKLPLIPGHEIVGKVVKVGKNVEGLQVGDRVGVPWLGKACGKCSFCRAGKENLCDRPLFTGYTIDGGFAEYTTADSRYCLPLGKTGADVETAPLLCAGLIGYRAYQMAGANVKRLGLYGFGAAAHILAQVARRQGKSVYSFTKPGDVQGQKFARTLGSVWAGGSNEKPPVKLDAAIIFAPVGALVPAALRAVTKGGKVVCGGIYMSDIPSFPYELLWGERAVQSVANLTRRDGVEFLALAPKVPVHVKVQVFSLDQANAALDQLRAGKIEGAAALSMDAGSKIL